MPEGIYISPERIPNCIDETSDALGRLVCEGCSPDCVLFRTGQRIQEFKDQISSANQLLSLVIKDEVIPDFYGPGAFDVLVVQNPELVNEILELEWGILSGDLRGLKGVNDTHGKWAGDALLCVAGQRMTMLRTENIGPPMGESERRRDPEFDADIGFRPTGADELALMVRRILPATPPAYQTRAQARFSIEQAIEDDRAGKIPVIANFTTVHASEFREMLPEELPTSKAERAKLALTIFKAVYKLADQNSSVGKQQQYEQMWEMVRTRENLPRRMPDDKRFISEKFLRYYCPNFWGNQREMLQHWERHV